MNRVGFAVCKGSLQSALDELRRLLWNWIRFDLELNKLESFGRAPRNRSR